jgi:hypothetical protein
MGDAWVRQEMRSREAAPLSLALGHRCHHLYRWGGGAGLGGWVEGAEETGV